MNGNYNPNINSAKAFAENHEISFYTDDLNEFYSKVDAVYIASPHPTHADYIRKSLMNGKHVLCEKPLVLKEDEAKELYSLAEEKNLILMEAIKTAYAPAFHKLISYVKSGAIGTVRDIEASFTKLMTGNFRELSAEQAGGSMTELSSYPLLPIIKLFGTSYRDITFYSVFENNIDVFTRAIIQFDNAVASLKVGLGVKTEGELIISGTKGYAYVPAPWWKTEFFELRYEDLNKTRKYFAKFEDDGLRYEISEFVSLINNPQSNYLKLNSEESIAIVGIIQKFREGHNIIKL